jgi:predicted nucleic acid-binding protein
MLVVVDANVLVGEVTRKRGRLLLAHSDLELLITDRAWDEAQHEIRKRYEDIARAGRLSEAALDAAEGAIQFLTPLVQPIGSVVMTPHGPVEVTDFMDDARRRIPDVDDIPTGALALAAGVTIWSEDAHFRGCGIAVWTTDRLKAYLWTT